MYAIQLSNAVAATLFVMLGTNNMVSSKAGCNMGALNGQEDVDGSQRALISSKQRDCESRIRPGLW